MWEVPLLAVISELVIATARRNGRQQALRAGNKLATSP
jgi:hypothetical protein